MAENPDTKEMVDVIKELCWYCGLTEQWQIDAVFSKVTGFVSKWAVYWQEQGRAAGLGEAIKIASGYIIFDSNTYNQEATLIIEDLQKVLAGGGE